jgi:hypothetical protein
MLGYITLGIIVIILAGMLMLLPLLAALAMAPMHIHKASRAGSMIVHADTYSWLSL